MNYLSDNLRFLMKKKKLNHEEMGKILGKGRSMIGYYANGKSQPDLDTLNKITNYFGVTIDDFLKTDLTRPKKFYSISKANVEDGSIMYGDPESEIRHLREKIVLLKNQVTDLREHIATQNMLLRNLKKEKKGKG